MLPETEKGRNVIYNRDVSNMHNLHKKKLEGMKSTVAALGYSAKPRTIPQVVRANLKKRMFEDERLAEIEVTGRLTYSFTDLSDQISESRLKMLDYSRQCQK